jgi:hypothetical protein
MTLRATAACIPIAHTQMPRQPNPHIMNKQTTLSIRIGGNSDHHLWNNNGTWWCHYTEHLADYTKRRVRLSLHTHDLGVARVLRDTLFISAGLLHQEFQRVSI